MASLLCHLHFWTLKALSPGTASGGDIGTHAYHDKSAGIQDESDLCRKEWAEGRGIMWIPRNRKPERLRDTLRESEELLSTHHPICMKWKALKHCLILLDNGILLTLTVAKHSGDVERIMIDKTLVGRIQGTADHGLILDRSIVLTLVDERRPVCVSLSARRHSGIPVPLTLTQSDSGRKLEKLSTHDPKVSSIDVKGMPTGIVDRHITTNTKQDLVAIWWKDTQDSGWQWSSMADSGAYNILIFRVNNGKLEYACGMQTENDPVDVQFSNNRHHILFTLERSSSSSYDSCIYEYSNKKISKVFAETKIPSEASVLVCERNKDETKLLLGCEDGTLILHDNSCQGQVQSTNAYFAPISLIRWHPAGSFVFVCSPKGEIQCYDLGLNPLLFQLASEVPQPTPILQLGVHIMAQSHLELAGWGSEPKGGEGHSGCYDNFIMVFDSGPVVLLRLELGVVSRGKAGPVELVSEYIRHKQLEQAVTLFVSMNWNFQPTECFACLTFIMDHLLTQPLCAKTEAQMESSLATFLAPKRSISRQVQNNYKDHITHLIRRFFHLLLRYRRLEKALRLAVDFAAKDLFMDIHFVALDCNENKLAKLAKQKAESLSSGDSLTDVLQSGVSLDEGSKLVDPLQFRLLEDHDDDGSKHGSPYSFDSLGSPHLEKATTFEFSTDDSSATASENEEEYSDNQATQEAVEEHTKL